jgi:outer membrane lipoprotein-sorting protein
LISRVARIRRAWTPFLALPAVLLSGCLFTTRKLPVPRAPQVMQTASGEELVEQLNKRWDALQSLNVRVQIQASVTNAKKSEATDFTSIRGIILMRKPEMVRVLGQLPVIGTKAFDMASYGKTFTLVVPPKSTAYKGSNTQPPKGTTGLQSMRPSLFFDAMFVRGIGPNDEYTKTADTDTQEDPAKKHLLLIPEYILSVMRPRPGSHELQPLRVIHFHREDLLPYQQDLYDEHNNLETQIVYGRYVPFGDNNYPSTITIKRPMEQYQVVLSVEKVTENMPLTDDQFQIKIPEGTKVQTIE